MAVFFVSTLIEPFKTYTNNEYGFSIIYPSEWHIFDDVVQLDSQYNTLVWFVPDLNIFETQISISKLKIDTQNISEQQYIDTLKTRYEEGCTKATLEKNGFICSNFSVVLVEGEPLAKVGRWYRKNDRLERVT